MLLFFFISLLLAHYEFELVPVPLYTSDINQVCRYRCQQCVCATPENIEILAKILRKHRVRQAAVCGWNGYKGNYLVTDNCRIKCYGSNLRGIDYVFCYRRGCRPYCDPCLPRRCYKPRCPPYYTRNLCFRYFRPFYLRDREESRDMPGDRDPEVFRGFYLLDDEEEEENDCD